MSYTDEDIKLRVNITELKRIGNELKNIANELDVMSSRLNNVISNNNWIGGDASKVISTGETPIQSLKSLSSSIMMSANNIQLAASDYEQIK